MDMCFSSSPLPLSHMNVSMGPRYELVLLVVVPSHHHHLLYMRYLFLFPFFLWLCVSVVVAGPRLGRKAGVWCAVSKAGCGLRSAGSRSRPGPPHRGPQTKTVRVVVCGGGTDTLSQTQAQLHHSHSETDPIHNCSNTTHSPDKSTCKSPYVGLRAQLENI